MKTLKYFCLCMFHLFTLIILLDYCRSFNEAPIQHTGGEMYFISALTTMHLFMVIFYTSRLVTQLASITNPHSLDESP